MQFYYKYYFQTIVNEILILKLSIYKNKIKKQPPVVIRRLLLLVSYYVVRELFSSPYKSIGSPPVTP